MERCSDFAMSLLLSFFLVALSAVNRKLHYKNIVLGFLIHKSSEEVFSPRPPKAWCRP